MSISLPIKGESDKKIGAYNAPLAVSAQDTPNMTVKVRAGAFFNSANVLTEFAGGNTAQISPPLSAAKWVVVGLTDAGSLTLIHGVNQASPSLPSIPMGVLALAAIYVTSTTTSLTPALVQDIRPFLRTVDAVADIANELANRPTFTDMDNALANKADIDGTTAAEFTLNKDNTTGSPGADAILSVKRGNAPDVALRWNESIDQWEFTNDGTNYGSIATTSGTFAPLVHTHVHTDVTDFDPSVDSRIAAASIQPSQVVGLNSALNGKADTSAFNAHAGDMTIHHTLPLAQTDITNLVADLASKADVSGSTFTGSVVVQSVGNQPIALVSTDSGSSGLVVDRTPLVLPNARLEWDESAGAWMAGTVGSMNTVLTGNVAVSSVNGQSGVVVLNAADVGAANAVHTHTSAAITDFTAAVTALVPVQSVNAMTGAVVLNAADVGASPTGHTHTSANITDFNTAVVSASPVQSVNGNTGVVILNAASVGAAPVGHTHTSANITDFTTAVQALIPPDAVSSVNSFTGAVVLSYSDVGAAPTVHTHTASNITDFTSAVNALIPPDAVSSVNSFTGAVVLNAADVGASPVGHTHTAANITDFNTAASAAAPVQSVNGFVGTVVLTASDVGAANAVHTHTSAGITDFSTAVDARIAAASINALNDVTISGPSAGQALVYTGSQWANTTIVQPVTGTVVTTDATVTTIANVAVPTDSAITLNLLANAFEPATGDSKSSRIFAALRNVGGTVSLVAPQQEDTAATAGAATWTVTVSAVGSNAAVQVTGEAAKTINWKTSVDYV